MSDGNDAELVISNSDAMSLVDLIVELVASEVIFAVLAGPASRLPSNVKFCPIVADFLTPKPPADVIAPVVLDVLYVVPSTDRSLPIVPSPDVLIVLAFKIHLASFKPNA